MEIEYIHLKKGTAHGGHKHTHREIIVVLNGAGYYTEIGSETSLPMQKGSVVMTKPSLAHAIMASEKDMKLLQIRLGRATQTTCDATLQPWVDWMNSLPPIKYTKRSTIMGRRK